MDTLAWNQGSDADLMGLHASAVLFQESTFLKQAVEAEHAYVKTTWQLMKNHQPRVSVLFRILVSGFHTSFYF